MQKIWQKSATNLDSDLAKLVEDFTVGRDHELDMRLIPYDVEASRAHAWGLEKIGVLSKSELADLEKAFTKLLEDLEAGKFVIEQSDEDCHTAIEKFLTEHCGEAGKKIHTGRSRNDQVVVAMRLYERDFIDQLSEEVKKLGEFFLDFAKKYEFTAMPGFTHTQRAMPSSVGMWAGSFAEILIWNLEQLADVRKRVNRCPLGSAAGFGVAFDLPREAVAKSLGFESPVVVAMSVQNTRLMIDAEILSVMANLGQTLGTFSNDLIWFSSAEFGFFSVDEALTTGSSIMPQKKNLDPAEIIRGEVGYLIGFEQTLRSMCRNLISGYHRESGRGKEALFGGFDRIWAMVKMSQALIQNTAPNAEKLAAKCTPEIFAADEANELVKGGMSFREAYVVVGESLNNSPHPTSPDGREDTNYSAEFPSDFSDYLEQNLRSKKHLGASGNLGLEVLGEMLKEF